MDEPRDYEWELEYAEYVRQQDEDQELTDAWELIEWNEQKQRQLPQ